MQSVTFVCAKYLLSADYIFYYMYLNAQFGVILNLFENKAFYTCRHAFLFGTNQQIKIRS